MGLFGRIHALFTQWFWFEWGSNPITTTCHVLEQEIHFFWSPQSSKLRYRDASNG